MTQSLPPIAVIGMAGRYPGANSAEALWRLLDEGQEGISHFQVDELDVPPRPDSPDATPNFVAAKGILDEVDMFDARFFGYYPREASLMDPQQRVFMECAWHALEDAGCDPYRYPGSIGVYAGCYIDTYLLANICADQPRLNRLVESIQIGSLETELGNDKDYLATRISYKFNLRGPSVTMQTACSTSLVAINHACQALLTYQADMAIAGAATITFPQKRGYYHKEGGMLSPDGHCRAFDADAGGTVFSNGVGAVVLKRLDEALADRDRIYAVIRGSACNNDGNDKVSYTAPSVDGQAEVIALAQDLAGVEARSIDYIECHGTATPLGDPIEVAALSKAFRRQTEDNQFCAIGSMKTNIGHLDCAAGVSGVIKVARALHHEVLPASLNYANPNPKIDFEQSPFFVNADRREWKRSDRPRRAGVSSFGVGGTNAHVVMEEAPEREPSAQPGYCLLPLSAKADAALNAGCDSLAEYLQKDPANLADVAYTLQLGRAEFDRRDFVVADSVESAVRELQARAQRGDKRPPTSEHPVVFMFPGQGAQFPGMTQQLYAEHPVFRQHMDECFDYLLATHQLDLRPMVFPADGDEAENAARLARTCYAQPAIFAIEYSLAKLWMQWGVKPTCLVGHSVGEFAAACIAGTLSLEDALTLVSARGRYMEDMPGGTMLSVRTTPDAIERYTSEEVNLAAVNSPQLCVLAGPESAIEAVAERLRKDDIQCNRLHTSHAFHSWMMDDAVPPTVEAASAVSMRPPEIPIMSTVTGQWLSGEQACDPNYWGKQLRQAVRFADAVRQLAQQEKFIFLECGPGQTLATLSRQSIKGEAVACIASLGHPNAPQQDHLHLLTALGQLWQAGARIDWSQVATAGQRIGLPGYAFQRKRFWIEPAAVPEQQSPPTNSQTDSTATTGSPTLGASSNEELEDIIRRQLDVLRKQMALLKQGT